LNAALTAERGDLVAADVWLEIICATNGNADTAQVSEIAANWTVDATRYVHVKAAEGHRAGTSWNVSKYRIDVAVDYGAAVRSTVPYFRATGIQARNTAAQLYSTGFNFGPLPLASDIRLDGVFTHGNYANGIFGDGGTYTFRNCVSVGNGAKGFLLEFGTGGATGTIDNCTAVANGEEGISTGSWSNTVAVRNCYSGGNTGDDFVVEGDSSLSACYSEDGSEATSTAAYATGSGARFTNVTSGSEDVALQAGSTLIGAGTDLSGSFTTDITGKTRSVPWDVGAFEFVANDAPRPISYYYRTLGAT
jgi:hypothetical protein